MYETETESFCDDFNKNKEMFDFSICSAKSRYYDGSDALVIDKMKVEMVRVAIPENGKNFLNHIIKLQNVLNMWRMRNLSLLGKISIFKTLAFSKIIHLTLVTSVPSSTIDLLNKIQKDFLWDILMVV